MKKIRYLIFVNELTSNDVIIEFVTTNCMYNLLNNLELCWLLILWSYKYVSTDETITYSFEGLNLFSSLNIEWTRHLILEKRELRCKLYPHACTYSIYFTCSKVAVSLPWILDLTSGVHVELELVTDVLDFISSSNDFCHCSRLSIISWIFQVCYKLL